MDTLRNTKMSFVNILQLVFQVVRLLPTLSKTQKCWLVSYMSVLNQHIFVHFKNIFLLIKKCNDFKQVTAVFVWSEIVPYSSNLIEMNSDQILIIFFLELFVFYQKYSFKCRLINNNYSVKNDHYLVKKCLIFSKKLKLIALFIIQIIIYGKVKQCICK